MEAKVCTKCGIEKPIADFWVTDKKRGYRRGPCKECDKAYQRLQYQRSDEFRRKAKANSSTWQKAHPPTAKQRRRGHLKHKYGLSAEQYEAMLVAQGGKCAICSSTTPGRTRQDRKWRAGHWNVDHCHATGRVRGLLCHTCNVRVGAYERLLADVGPERLKAYLTPAV